MKEELVLVFCDGEDRSFEKKFHPKVVPVKGRARSLHSCLLSPSLNYTGNKDMLGRCEQFFLELMKVPRVESKLRVFSFRITFAMQVNDLRTNLNTINDASNEVKGSKKLRQIMQTILTLGNVLNQGTARGSAVGFKLDSLLKLSDIRARNNKMTLMHYLCKDSWMAKSADSAPSQPTRSGFCVLDLFATDRSRDVL
ncbi:hypothetical protein Taro_027673 [Colocasia esculenta]|uniref:FH2 domain-containing protein n=1 Tax=Colocasia esculenta TaxID=4460 RepID=A0A843VGD0_COLES|nr:hypothetical protein [Colocasia esculenta]